MVAAYRQVHIKYIKSQIPHDSKKRAVETIERLYVLGARDADIKRVLGLGVRDPVVWRWKNQKQGMTITTAKTLLKLFSI